MARRDDPRRERRLWIYSGSTAKRRKRLAPWPEDPPPDDPPRPAKPRTKRLRGRRAQPHEWLAGVAALLVGGAIVLVVAQYEPLLAAALFLLLTCFALFQLWWAGRRS